MLKQNILRTIKEVAMMRSGETVLVAVSGGVDSTALLLLLDDMKKDLKITIIAAHLNHKIRGKAADADARFVRSLCGKLRIKCVLKSFDVPKFAKQGKLNLEDAARQARYSFLEKTASEVGAKRIAVAHTADDNVETFIMRLLRGAGLRGLSGIPAVRGRVIRPLIRSTRDELEGYLKEKKINPRVDKSNFDIKYERNRIRHRLLPALEKYNPNLRKTILNTIEAAKEESGHIRSGARQALKDAAIVLNKDIVKVSTAKLNCLDATMASEVIREAFETVKGDLMDVSYINVSDTLALAKKTRGHLDLPGIQVDSNGPELMITREGRPEKAVPEFNKKLTLPGITKMKHAGYIINSKIIKAPKGGQLKVKDPFTAYMDIGKSGKPLFIRNRRAGDAFFPLGLKGKKKLQDIFVDLKVPFHKRDSVPIVHDGNEILWVVGYRISDKVKVTPSTIRAVKLTAKEI